jgi:hypothetical protein
MSQLAQGNTSSASAPAAVSRTVVGVVDAGDHLLGATHFIEDDLEQPELLVIGQRSHLACMGHRGHAGDALGVDEAPDVATQAGLVHGELVVERKKMGGNDPVELDCHGQPFPGKSANEMDTGASRADVRPS